MHILSVCLDMAYVTSLRSVGQSQSHGQNQSTEQEFYSSRKRCEWGVNICESSTTYLK